MDRGSIEPALTPGRNRVHEVIFEADTPAGRAFDIALLWSIVLSTAALLLESVESIRLDYGPAFEATEWLFTGLFSVEYALRLWCVRSPARYATSFFGVVDLISIVPGYISLVIPGAQPLMVVRALRLLRIFRVFKLGHFVSQGNTLMLALRASRAKITVFLFAVLNMVLVIGALMYLVEGGPETRFSSIPQSMYWAIVTMTTVGYGDIAPQSPLGQFLASVVMVIGYGIIAIPTGIISVEIARAGKEPVLTTQHCPHCSREGHDVDAVHCKFCGKRL